MSEKRQAAMATIAGGLQSPQPKDARDAPGPLQDKPVSSLLAPGPVSDLVPGSVPSPAQPAPAKALTPEQQVEAAKRQQATLTMQKRAGINRAFNIGQQAFGGVRGTVNSVQNGLAGASLPGGLALPIITLLILFLLLVQVNGSTRFSWLWQVMTGNAFLGPQSTPVTHTSTDVNATVANPTQYSQGVLGSAAAQAACVASGGTWNPATQTCTPAGSGGGPMNGSLAFHSPWGAYSQEFE